MIAQQFQSITKLYISIGRVAGWASCAKEEFFFFIAIKYYFSLII